MPILLASFALSPSVQAVSPPPDGGYPGGNTAEGQNSLLSLTTGVNNSGIGFEALKADTSGNHNTGIGVRTLWSNTIGSSNAATGAFALPFNTSGAYNVANGFQALYHNTTASYNTAAGYQALSSNTTGFSNTANGASALAFNTTGSFNTATGYQAIYHNTTASFNTATGYQAFYQNSIGSLNTAYGASALGSNTTGSENTACGTSALAFNRSGSNNIALGSRAGADIKGDNNIDIGNTGDFDDSDTIRIGDNQNAVFIAGIYNATVIGSPVYIDTNTSRLGLSSSSKRFKDAIEAMGNASEALLALRPVTFRYKEGIDPNRTAQFGLVAEDVEKVNPELVVHDKEGRPYTVRYDAVNAMLLNEFLKEHRKVEQLTKDFESKFADQQKQIEALTTGLQKVTARLDANMQDRNVVVAAP
jgi:Chaperone of endosialidase